MLIKTYYKRNNPKKELKIYHMLVVCQVDKTGNKIYASEFITNVEYNVLKNNLGVKELEYGKEVIDND